MEDSGKEGKDAGESRGNNTARCDSEIGGGGQGKCILELTADGDLPLKGPNHDGGWPTETSAEWELQFPNRHILWGQRLGVATQLTSFPRNPTSFYSFEIQHDRVTLLPQLRPTQILLLGLEPSKNRNITYVQVGWRGLHLLDGNIKKIAQVLPFRQPGQEAPRFLSLNNATGNMGLYNYSPEESMF
ncbi:hypothetical protein SAY87_012230 [Trapa incisa]|uniref:Uncharacterized protein n=1 Tax=Trapa incisa TaxID=236973 RepID=A0AAN7GJP9_9MYRT|nr:hypothetical protein SAY87_012230 [Trapa incisa]